MFTEEEKKALFKLLQESGKVKCYLKGDETAEDISLTTAFYKLRLELYGY